MKRHTIISIYGWITRISGTVILIIPLIALFRALRYGPHFEVDWRTYFLYIGMIAGLSLAYKWPLIGGLIATVSILVSGFLHPLVMLPGVLYIIYGIILRRQIRMDGGLEIADDTRSDVT